MNSDRERISPTAYATGAIWVRHGLAPPQFSTVKGEMMLGVLRPALAAWAALGGPSLQDILLARHRSIDALLAQQIEAGKITQVIEVAAGLSGRGLRFSERYGSVIRYIETDLPGMLERKQSILGQLGGPNHNHQLAVVDAMHDDGEQSLAKLCESLDSSQGLAIITEGLLNYLDNEQLLGLWQRIAKVLAAFSVGQYYSDLHVSAENEGVGVSGFGSALGAFVKGRVHLHFEQPDDATAALLNAGFSAAQLLKPVDVVDDLDEAATQMVRIVATETSGRIDD